MRYFLPLILILASFSGRIYGQTFYRETSGTTATLCSINFPSDARGVAAGSSGTVVITTDGGQNWAPYISDVAVTFRAVFFNDSTHGAIVGDQGTILTFLPSLSTPLVQLPESKNIYAITFPTYDTAFIVGAQGLIYKSNDSGKNWYKINPPALLANRNFYGADYFDDSTYWIVGAGGIVLYTEDAGTTWQRIPVPSTKDLYSICFPDSTGAGWIVGDSTILYTSDGGDTWTSVPTTARLRYVTGYDSLDAYACGLSGALLATNDLKHWNPIAIGTTTNLYGIDIPDSLYVCGDSGVILSTLPPIAQPASDFSIDSVDFGQVIVADTEFKSDVLHNVSSSPVTITAITVDSSEFTFIPNSVPLPFTIPANGSLAITIQFRPSYSGKVKSLLRATSSDDTVRTAILSGEGYFWAGVNSSKPAGVKLLTITSGSRAAFLDIPDDWNSTLHITLLNELGAQVISHGVIGFIFDAGPLPPGVYFYRISGDEGFSTGKFILN